MSAQNLNANTLFNNANAALKNNKSIDEIFSPLNKALSIRDNHPDYALYKIGLLLQAYKQTKVEQYYTLLMDQISQLKKVETHNRGLVEQELQAYLIKDQLDKALTLIKTQIPNYSWDITLYESAISIDLGLSEKARVAKNTTNMDKYWNDAQQVKNEVLSKMKDLEKIPKEIVQVREFKITKNMAYDLGKISFTRGQYVETVNYLKAYISDQFDDEQNKEIARWYLAALQKQNQNDQVLYDKLIANDAKERDQINALVNAKY